MRVIKHLIWILPVLLIAILLIRTATFAERQASESPQPLDDLPVETGRVARHLADVLRLQTVTFQDTVPLDTTSFHALHRYLEETFPHVHAGLDREIVNGLSLLFTWPGSSPNLAPVLLMAHQDVVPIEPDTEDQWIHPPFGGVIADGFIWGRGTLDIKSGMMGILEAVEMLRRDGHQPARTIYIAFGHDEEIGGRNGAAHIAALLESRGVRLEVVLDEGGAIVDGVIPGVDGPVALVGMAEKGYVSLELTARGRGGHSAMPPQHTSIGILSKAVADLENSPFPANMRHAEQFLSHLHPRLPLTRRIVIANLWLFRPLVRKMLTDNRETNALIRTTTAVTMFEGGIKDNVLPKSARAIVNFRILPGETVAKVTERVRKTIDNPDIHIRTVGSAFDPAPVSDIESTSYAMLERTIRQLGATEEILVVPYLTVGATDSRYFTTIADDVYRFFFSNVTADDVERIHGTNERIAVGDYARLVTFYTRLIQNCDEL